MKNIKPYKIPTGEGFLNVSVLEVKSIYDNLESHVVFQANFFIKKGKELTLTNSVNVELNEGNYKTWDATAEGAYKIVSQKIGVELDGEYEPEPEPVQEMPPFDDTPLKLSEKKDTE